jgi:asparagine synthase (glutamine-hydrolysing)
MSAIFGIINKKEQIIEPVTIAKIMQAIAHRAVDGKGIWQEENIAFGHCKLLVTPEQQYEQLPAAKDDLVITANTRIDNRDELIRLLNIDKQLSPTLPDDQLIVAAYQKWEQQCLNYIEGEFAFAIWSKRSQQLFIASDHIGYRPVFYYDSPDLFIFCSEIKGILAVKPGPNYFNDESLIEYYFRRSDLTQTYNKEVQRLCGGNKLTWQTGSVKIERYWNPQPTGKYHFKKDEEWTACLRELLFKTVENRLRTDLPVGITLSGGLDSSSIACILAPLLAKKNKPLYAFSSVLPPDYNGPEQDERKYIEIMNRHCPNIIQTYVEAEGKGPFEDVQQAFEITETFPNPFFYMDRTIMEAAKEKKIRTLFSGYGGDYWVSWKGGTVIYDHIQRGKLKRAWQLLRDFRKTEQKSWIQLVRSEYLSHTELYKKLYTLLKGKSAEDQFNHTILQPGFFSDYNTKAVAETTKNITHFIQYCIKTGRIGYPLGLMNNENEHYSLQSAFPLLDRTISEFVMDLPTNIFVKGGYRRSLVRSSMGGILPPEIQWRKDKQAYSPDYNRRILQSRYLVDDIIRSNTDDSAFGRYICKKNLITYLSNYNTQTALGIAAKIDSIRIAQTGIAGSILSNLEKEGYMFS